jgi:hypothetical protein
MRTAIALVFALVAISACKDAPSVDDNANASTSPGKPGRRDVFIGGAQPLCSAEAQSYMAAKASGWWKSSLDPTGRGPGPYAYAGVKPSGEPPIREVVVALHARGIELATDPRAHRWEASPQHARLTLEAIAKGEPGFLATFELAPKGDALAIESLSILRGQTRWSCGPEGQLVASP